MERIDLSSEYSPIELALHSCRYLPAKELVAGKKVLDIACGEGIGVGLLLEWGAAEVVGVDLSSSAVANAKRVFEGQSNARFVAEDAMEFLAKHGEEFDVIISVETVEHLPDPEAFLERLAQKRRADATVIISCPNDYFYYGRGKSLNPFHVTQFSFYDFRTAAERHLGEAEWYLGAPLNGFAAVSANSTNQSAANFAASLKSFAPSIAGTVPAPVLTKDKLKPSTSLFYLGIWTQNELSSTYQVSFPATSHYRLPGITNVSDDIGIGRTHRVAFIIDQHEWAFDNIVKNMQPYLEGRYNISFYYISDYDDKAKLLNDVFVENNYDNVHFMWREFLFFALSNARIMLDLLKMSKLSASDLADRMAAPVLTTSVYDHLFLREEDVEERQEQFALVDGYATSSAHLQKAYNSFYERKPVVEISDGVNWELFEPARAAQSVREVSGDQVVQIGWVGNSAWGKDNASMVEDAKGLHSILVPAIERLALEGYPVTLALADRNIRKRDRAEMVTYYGEIDILVCSSAAEGTPNPILEAMASGVPFVSTDVGIVREAAGPLQEKFILKQRNVLSMYHALKQMLDKPETRAEIAAENLSRIVDWKWETKTPRWLRLFATAEHNHAVAGRKLRQAVFHSRLTQWEHRQTISELRKEMASKTKAGEIRTSKLQEANQTLRSAHAVSKDKLKATEARSAKLQETNQTLRKGQEASKRQISKLQERLEIVQKNLDAEKSRSNSIEEQLNRSQSVPPSTTRSRLLSVFGRRTNKGKE